MINMYSQPPDECSRCTKSTDINSSSALVTILCIGALVFRSGIFCANSTYLCYIVFNIRVHTRPKETFSNKC